MGLWAGYALLILLGYWNYFILSCRKEEEKQEAS
jgi:hypothetical protein